MDIPQAPNFQKRRTRSPGLKWYKRYDTPESLKSGRVLVIDYIKKGIAAISAAGHKRSARHCNGLGTDRILDHSKEGMRKVAAQEINHIQGLRKLYSNVLQTPSA